jgi:hypothetical protein
MAIDPHLITMDLLVLAKRGQANIELLASCCLPVLIKALQLRGIANKAMVADIVEMMLLMVEFKQAQTQLQYHFLILTEVFETLFPDPLYFAEVGNPFRTLLGKISHEPLVEFNPAPIVNLPPQKSFVPTAYACLFYNWKQSKLVKELDILLQSSGVQVHADFRPEVGCDVDTRIYSIILLSRSYLGSSTFKKDMALLSLEKYW